MGTSVRPGSAYKRAPTASGRGPAPGMVGISTHVKVDFRPVTQHGLVGIATRVLKWKRFKWWKLESCLSDVWCGVTCVCPGVGGTLCHKQKECLLVGYSRILSLARYVSYEWLL